MRRAVSSRGSALRWIAIVVFFVGLIAIKLFRGGGEWVLPNHGAAPVTVPIETAFVQQRSNVQVVVTATVQRVMPDDTKGNPHQRFLLRMPSGLTVLVAHNLELAPRVPLSAGDTVEVAGEYEWNEKGGVLHWTHHDPKSRHRGGYIRYQGHDYR